ncbi:transcription factor HES-1-B-like [Branchiostoma lanceolatum]|uniref:transcription factor HES-1-B-like n=1 Tax=Branchiostoma lanceolatum TaxID=7740 RepID=UPI0034539166
MPVEKVVESYSPYYQSRKSSKPLMEKRRRARINSSLNELKNLILDTYKTDMNSSSNSKLEKADILEIAVKHVRSLQRQQMTAATSTDPAALGRYRAGYSRCRAEVARFMGTANGVDPQVRQKLLNHLDSCSQRVENSAHPMVHHPDTTVRTGYLHSHHGRQASPVPAAMYGIVPVVPEHITVSLPNQTLPSSQHTVSVYANNRTTGTPARLSPVYGLTHSPVSAQNGLTTATTYQSSSAQTAVIPAGFPSALPISESDKVWRPW